MQSGFFDYLDSIKARDPAPRSRWEVLLYPGLWALGFHRVAHWLYRGDLFFLARLVNHFGRFFTAIDIHPGAVIGRNFFIDHGFVVIGETAEIGDDVTLYQGVTLGGTSLHKGKRHPTLRDGVIVGSGAQVLGGFTVGAEARIGANAVVLAEVPPGVTVVGIPAKPVAPRPPRREPVEKFLPYGTPCDEIPDPVARALNGLLDEVTSLRARVAELELAGTAPGHVIDDAAPVRRATASANGNGG